MIQLNFYKKRCYLTDSEKAAVNEFFKNLFKVDNMTDVHIYIDEAPISYHVEVGGPDEPTVKPYLNKDVEVIADIEGFEIPKSTLVGSGVQHDSPTQ
jgi:hypothetical protein